MTWAAFTSEWTKLKRKTLLLSTFLGLAVAASIFVILIFSQAQATGSGAVLSFKTDTPRRAIQIMQKVKLWSVAVSLGGVESILSYPVKMSHASIPPKERERLGITDNLIRLSVGLEEAEDLMEDLETGSRSLGL